MPVFFGWLEVEFDVPSGLDLSVSIRVIRGEGSDEKLDLRTTNFGILRRHHPRGQQRGILHAVNDFFIRRTKRRQRT